MALHFYYCQLFSRLDALDVGSLRTVSDCGSDSVSSRYSFPSLWPGRTAHPESQATAFSNYICCIQQPNLELRSWSFLKNGSGR